MFHSNVYLKITSNCIRKITQFPTFMKKIVSLFGREFFITCIYTLYTIKSPLAQQTGHFRWRPWILIYLLNTLSNTVKISYCLKPLLWKLQMTNKSAYINTWTSVARIKAFRMHIKVVVHFGETMRFSIIVALTKLCTWQSPTLQRR